MASAKSHPALPHLAQSLIHLQLSQIPRWCLLEALLELPQQLLVRPNLQLDSEPVPNSTEQDLEQEPEVVPVAKRPAAQILKEPGLLIQVRAD
jgi:hypothetical protein